MDDKKLVPDAAREAFRQGYDIGHDAIERCSKEVPEGNEPTKGAMTGLLASVIEALYTLAPSFEVADFLIEGCSDIGKRMAEENKKAVEKMAAFGQTHEQSAETLDIDKKERGWRRGSTTQPLH